VLQLLLLLLLLLSVAPAADPKHGRQGCICCIKVTT
jgi:hypothetical protein